jgi:uncharacterized protein (DUF433 family)
MRISSRCVRLAACEVRNTLDFDRITFDPKIMGGRACIRGMRITVSLIVNLVSSGMTIKEILEDYPYLDKADVEHALKFSAMTLVKV